MRAILATILVAVLLGAGGVYLWQYFGGFATEKDHVIEFINAYGDYSAIAREVEDAAHAPGTGANSDRAELERLLTTLLTETLTAERREDLARLAYNNLNALKRQVDVAQTKQAMVYGELEKIDAIAKAFKSGGLGAKTGAIVTLARKRAELSARITSLLSEMNEQTYAIIARILEDKGELTREHIQYINETTAVAEERHATLSALYSELEARADESESLFKELIRTAL